ncbi:uncharacterized protein LOC123917345 [Trifolium pratense]|uniref:Uncharacterized protein n=1 Tax=Trifolium pratense TaxID=57577 RepID=A0ACB0J7Q6_TRIPR|nr:uncharacterized protein LOC123917345 [Trifolium pratense]CAJ2640585.1 unnamed protein product [Trifolium pratense]
MELEQAKEELEILETLYPNQHHYLKHELRSLITQLQNTTTHSYSHPLPQYNTSHLFLDTEESTNLEQTKKIQLVLPEREVVEKEKKGAKSSDLESPKSFVMKHYPSSKKNKRKDRVDLVLERAENCLKKIRLFKKTLFSSS